MKRLLHELPKIYSKESKVLILGSFPSVKSRKISYYYGHKMNRFWKVLSFLFKEDIPDDNDSRTEFILRHNLALWDVIESCEIVGSSDSSIKNVKVNDIKSISNNSNLRLIICNGNKAYDLYQKHVEGVDIPVIKLPSTSPANAGWSLERLCEQYKVILDYLK